MTISRNFVFETDDLQDFEAMLRLIASMVFKGGEGVLLGADTSPRDPEWGRWDDGTGRHSQVIASADNFCIETDVRYVTVVETTDLLCDLIMEKVKAYDHSVLIEEDIACYRAGGDDYTGTIFPGWRIEWGYGLFVHAVPFHREYLRAEE